VLTRTLNPLEVARIALVERFPDGEVLAYPHRSAGGSLSAAWMTERSIPRGESTQATG
jgi:hypothetical protein